MLASDIIWLIFEIKYIYYEIKNTLQSESLVQSMAARIDVPSVKRGARPGVFWDCLVTSGTGYLRSAQGTVKYGQSGVCCPAQPSVSKVPLSSTSDRIMNQNTATKCRIMAKDKTLDSSYHNWTFMDKTETWCHLENAPFHTWESYSIAPQIDRCMSLLESYKKVLQIICLKRLQQI